MNTSRRIGLSMLVGLLGAAMGCAAEAEAPQMALAGQRGEALTDGATAEIQLGTTPGSDWWQSSRYAAIQTFTPSARMKLRYAKVCFYENDAATNGRLLSDAGALIATAASAVNTGEACGWQDTVGYRGRLFKFVFATAPTLTAGTVYRFAVDGGANGGYGMQTTYPSQYAGGVLINGYNNVSVSYTDMIGTLGYSPEPACTPRCTNNTTWYPFCGNYTVEQCPYVGGAPNVCVVQCL